METVMKRPEVNLEDAKDVDKWKSKVKIHQHCVKILVLDAQVTGGSPVFVKQYTIPLKYQNIINDETKRLEGAGLISRSLSNWTAPWMVVAKKQDSDKPNEIQPRMVIRLQTAQQKDFNIQSTGQKW